MYKKNILATLSTFIISISLSNITFAMQEEKSNTLTLSNINTTDIYGQTPLYLACKYGHINTVKILIENDADINIKDGNDTSPLFIAYANGQIDIADLLIKNGAIDNVNTEDNTGKTPIFYAYIGAHFKTIKKLKDIGANSKIDTPDKLGRTPIFYAYAFGNFDIVEALKDATKYGDDTNAIGNINMRNNKGETPLFFTCKRKKHNSKIKILLQNGADINAENNYGQTVLFKAFMNGRIKFAKKLISYGASGDINTYDNFGKTPLFYAYCNMDIKTTKKLLENGAKGDINIKDTDGKTPADTAYEKNDIETFNQLINIGAYSIYSKNEKPQIQEIQTNPIEQNFTEQTKGKIESTIQNLSNTTKNSIYDIQFSANSNTLNTLENQNQYKPNKPTTKDLLEAYKNNDFKKAKEIVKNLDQSEIESTDFFIQPMFHAYSYGDKKSIKILKSRGANSNVNQYNVFGQTPIFIAYSRGDFETVKYLKMCGAKGEIVTINTTNKNIEISNNTKDNNLKIEQKSKASVDIKDFFGQSPIFVAYSQGNFEAVSKLNNAKIYGESSNARGNINMRTKFGRTPVFVAIANENIEIAEKLIANGADKNCIVKPDEHGVTPLFFAYSIGNIELATKIIQLIKKYIDVKDYPKTFEMDITDKNGRTPLFQACLEGNIEVIDILRKNCKNWDTYVNIFDNNNETAHNISLKVGQEYIANMLEKSGAKYYITRTVNQRINPKTSNFIKKNKKKSKKN